jgi:hypothetical protein
MLGLLSFVPNSGRRADTMATMRWRSVDGNESMATVGELRVPPTRRLDRAMPIIGGLDLVTKATHCPQTTTRKAILSLLLRGPGEMKRSISRSKIRALRTSRTRLTIRQHKRTTKTDTILVGSLYSLVSLSS